MAFASNSMGNNFDPNDPYSQIFSNVSAKYAKMMQQQLMSQNVAFTTYNMPSRNNNMNPFSPGDRVVLIKGEGRSRSKEHNPEWGRDGDYIAGRVDDVNRHGPEVVISWDNGSRNIYSILDAKIVPHHDAPKPKGKTGWKKGDKSATLDTTKLDPLIIDPAIKSEIVALLQQHKHADKIFDEWGLGELIEYGRGMTLMFHGGPGTGKTFGARCIAKALGKELLVIGAAEIQSSEPGGANRAIQEAFATCEKDNKVLFIDECDSLIANRANLGMILASEINTLLTEIEKCEGVVILATNRISDMDSALERRLSLIIKFPNPSLEQRIAIWKGLLPAKMPLNIDVEIERLAAHELTGGLIKNIVLQAARLAVADNAKDVQMAHFDKAIARVKSSQNLMGKKRVQSDEVGVGTSTNKKEVIRKIDDL